MTVESLSAYQINIIHCECWRLIRGFPCSFCMGGLFTITCDKAWIWLHYDGFMDDALGAQDKLEHADCALVM